MTKIRQKKDVYAERIAAYVDSPRLKQRVKAGNSLFCVVNGDYGKYNVRLTVGRTKIKNAQCTCPSEYWPCKHVHALLATYEKSPNSFVDVDKLLEGLKTKSQTELLKLLREMIEVSPSCLKAFGEKGFDVEDEDEYSEEQW